MAGLGRRDLIRHGIFNDESKYRVHLCFGIGMSYIFPTSSANQAAESGKYKGAVAGQPGVEGVTAWGYLVPCNPFALLGLGEVGIPEDLLADALFRIEREEGPMATRVKGELAEEVGREMRRRGLFEPYIEFEAVSVEEQMRGIDESPPTFQYKCDFPGGPKDLGGTGYLYIQVEERNPLGVGKPLSL